MQSSRIGKLKGLAFDIVERSLWAYSEKCVWRIQINDEDRKVVISCERSLRTEWHCRSGSCT
jgi:hypothetical protein